MGARGGKPARAACVAITTTRTLPSVLERERALQLPVVTSGEWVGWDGGT
jgi:maleate cis-trans isomerase